MANAAIVDKVIGEVSYRLVRLDPIKAGRIAMEVGQILAAGFEGNEKGISDLLGIAQTHSEETKAAQAADPTVTPEVKTNLFETLLSDGPRLISALAGGIAHIDSGRLYDLGLACITNQLFASNSRLNDTHALNRHFADVPAHLLQVLVWAVQVNCAGFFVLDALASKLAARVAQA